MVAGASSQVARALARAADHALLGGVLLAVAVIPLLVDPSHPADLYYGPKARALHVVGAALAVVWLTRVALEPARLDRAVALPAVAFALVAGAATWRAVDPAWSLRGAPWRHEGLLTLLAYVAVCLASATLREPRRRWWWLGGTLVAGVLAALYGVAQALGVDWLPRDPARVGWQLAFATTGNPIYLGAYMVLLAPLALAAHVVVGREVMRLAALLALLVLFGAGLLTHSRAAWLALAVALGLMGLGCWRRRRAVPPRRVALALGLLGALAALFFTPGRSPLPGSDPGSSGAAALARAQSMGNLQDGSLRERLYYWRVAGELLARSPLLGYGPEGFPVAVPQLPDPRSPAPLLIEKAHNDTLDMALSVGLLGLAAFWWLVAVALRRAWRTARRLDAHAVAGLAAVAAIVGYLVNLQFSFSVVSVAPVFWSLLGVAAALEPPHGSRARADSIAA